MDNADWLRELDTPLAKELAETLLLQNDMLGSIAAMELWSNKYSMKERSSEERIIGQSLFRDAVVQFVGCFDKTAEYPLLVNDIYNVEDGGTTYFQWLEDLRDAYAAHKFGAQRQCVIGVTIHPQLGLALGFLMAIYQGAEKEGGPKLIAFMQLAVAHIDEKVKRLQQRVLESAQAMTPEQISTLRPARAFGVDPSEVRMSRSALQKSRAKQNG